MKLVIFDCDGTLVDSQNNITAAMTWAFQAHDLPVPSRPEILRCVGLSLPETFRVLAAQQAPSLQNSLAEHYRGAFVHGPLQQRGPEPLYPGIAETIAALAIRPDICLGVATGKSRRGVARLFDREGWHEAFATIQTADDHPSKPHPSMILTAMRETGIDADATVMIGDTAYDMAMARAAGVASLGVAWGYHEIERLRAGGAHHVVTDAVELLGAIDRALAGGTAER